jgi:hypothetical protein
MRLDAIFFCQVVGARLVSYGSLHAPNGNELRAQNSREQPLTEFPGADEREFPDTGL